MIKVTNTSLVKLYPLTGRSHQLRAHLSYIGYPIVNDTLYGGNIIDHNEHKDNDQQQQQQIEINESLYFIDPITKKKLLICSYCNPAKVINNEKKKSLLSFTTPIMLHAMKYEYSTTNSNTTSWIYETKIIPNWWN